MAKQPAKIAPFVPAEVVEAAEAFREVDAAYDAAKKKTVDARAALAEATAEEEQAKSKAETAFAALVKATTGKAAV